MGQKNDQNQVGEQSCEVNNLEKDVKRELWSTFLDTVGPIYKVNLGVGRWSLSAMH